jgi:hypothetical protein
MFQISFVCTMRFMPREDKLLSLAMRSDELAPLGEAMAEVAYEEAAFAPVHKEP